MDTNNKIIVSAVLILAISFVAFNFVGLTGKSVANCQKSWATVTPSLGMAGDKFHIEFYSPKDVPGYPSANGFRMPVEIYRLREDGKLGERVDTFRTLDGGCYNTCDSGSVYLRTIGRFRSGDKWEDGKYAVVGEDLCNYGEYGPISTHENSIFATFRIEGTKVSSGDVSDKVKGDF